VQPRKTGLVAVKNFKIAVKFDYLKGGKFVREMGNYVRNTLYLTFLSLNTVNFGSEMV